MRYYGIARVLVVAVLVLCVLSISGCISDGQSEQADEPDHLSLATSYVTSFFDEEYDDAYAMMSNELQEALPKGSMMALRSQLVQQYGEMQEVLDSSDVSEEGYLIAHVTCGHSEGATVVYRVVFEESEVAGFFIDEVTYDETVPPYVQLDAFTETELSVGTPDYPLPAVLTMPKGNGPFPLVVLVHGSGASDKDESVGANKPFRDIAWGLASRGVAVLRYDKRTYVYTSEIAGDIESFTMADETVNDAIAAMELVSSFDGIDPSRVIVVGHSLGGYAAPLIVLGTDVIDGIVLLAAPARPMQDLVVEQTEYLCLLDGDITDQEAAAIAAVKDMAERINGLSIGSEEVIMGASLAYWEYLSEYDPVERAAESGIPFLVLQGERDYQVTMEDFLLWQGGLGELAAYKTYALLNHLMIAGEGQPGPDEYNIPGHVSEDVIIDIAEWCFGL